MSFTAAPAPAPTPTSDLPMPITFLRPPRRNSKWVVAGAAALAVGVVGWMVVRNDDGTSKNIGAPGASTVSNTPIVTTAVSGTAVNGGSAGNASITREELDAAYSATFGVTGSAASLDCVATQMGGAGSQTERLAHGELLTFDEATAAFTPFVTCAPDADFLAMMVPSAVQALGGNVDESCVTQGFLTFGVQGRAQARALALVDLDGFASSLQNAFGGCAF